MNISKPFLSNEELEIYLSSKTRGCAEALYDKYANALFLTIIRIVPQKETAEDVLEQTFIEAWNSFELYSSERRTILSWMMGIAHNLANEALSCAPTSHPVPGVNPGISADSGL